MKGKFSSIDETIKKNINFTKTFDNEPKFAKWFEKNYLLLGFDKIIKKNPTSFPDYVMQKGSQEIRVELETLSSRFITHKHNPKEVDLVICLKENKKIPVKTIEVDLFDYGYPKKNTQAQIKKSVLKILAKSKIHPQQSYSEVIDKLLEEKEKVQKLISDYCELKNPTSHDLFKLFSDLTGFSVKEFNNKLREGVKE